MTVVLDNPRNFDDPAQAREWIWQQLQALEQGFNSGREFLMLDERHEPPKKLKPGMTVLADGTDWNPGSGAGVYTYYGGAWHKLG